VCIGGVYLPQDEIYSYIKNESFDAVVLMGAGKFDTVLKDLKKGERK
jgi:hypothetical protein